MEDAAFANDPLLQPLLLEASGDPGTVGVIIHGSRGAGVGDRQSDYDLIWVLTDEGYDRRVATGLPLEETTKYQGRKLTEISYTCLRRLAGPSTPDWIIQGLATARVLLDKTGEVARTLDTLVTIPREKARAEVAEMFDGYLNGFYRSMKAARRGNELGARLQAAESLMYLVRTLFALERRRPPFHDRLATALDTLDQQGWASGELSELFLVILRTAEPERQKTLEARVESLLRERGYGDVVEAWDGEIERVKGL